MSKKLLLIILIVVIVLGFGLYQLFIKNNKPNFVLEKVSRGTVLKEISETGTVKISEEINLSFENVGKIEKIYVEVGDKVKADQNLAELETSQLLIQLREARAGLEVAEANYNKLLAGASQEEIKVKETAILDAELDIETAQQNLEDTRALAQEKLDNAYEDGLDTLDSAYLEIYNTFNKVGSIQRTYFTFNDLEGLRVKENKDKIKKALDWAKSYIDKAKDDPQNENIDIALSEVKKALIETSNALEEIRETVETIKYRDTVSSADKTSLDTYKSNINTAYTDIVSDQQTISETKVDNAADINTAQAEVSAAEIALQKAEDELSLLKAEPRQEEIDLHQAQIKQAQAQVSLLKNRIYKASLRSPAAGQITEIDKREGEMIQPTDSVISFLPLAPFQVKVDIYEGDIVNVEVGNPVDIVLVALPDQVFEGTVVSIDPAEKLIEGVVYYELTIDFSGSGPREVIKPGMTADIVIESERKENVLVVPKGAVEKKNGKRTVRILKNGRIEEREIKIGLEGNDFVEVVSGLNEGQEVIIE